MQLFSSANEGLLGAIEIVLEGASFKATRDCGVALKTHYSLISFPLSFLSYHLGSMHDLFSSSL